MDRASIVPASLVKRSLAYGVDAAIILIPLGWAVWWTSQHLFSPKTFIGWAALGAILFIFLAYTLVLAAQNASTGQTVGKRLIGLRTLRAESLKTGDFADSYARGFSFALGLLGLGIAPLRMATRFGEVPETELWPHRGGNTRVIDIRGGKDPLSSAERFFPVYPEEWVEGQERQVPVVLFPPQSAPWLKPPMEVAALSSERGMRNSGTEAAEVERKRKIREVRLAGVQTGLTLGSTVAALVALIFAANALKPAAPTPRDPQEVLASSIDHQLPQTGYKGKGFPGYRDSPDWTQPVSATAKTFSTIDNVFVIDGTALTILYAETGKVAASIPLSKAVDVSAQTQYSGKPGIYWSIGKTAYGWSAKTGPKPFSAKIPDGANPYAAGDELLFVAQDQKTQKYRTWRFTERGFREIPVPSGFTPGSLTSSGLASYSLTGDIRVTDSQGKDVSAYPLRPPRDGIPFAGVVATGSNSAVSLWSPFPDSSAPSTPVIIAVYEIGTGKLMSYIETTRGRIDAYPALTWGPDGRTALYGGYLFDVASGRPTLDLLAQKIEPISVIGEGVLGDSSLGSVYALPTEIRSIAGVTPLIANGELAVVRTHSQRLEKYSR